MKRAIRSGTNMTQRNLTWAFLAALCGLFLLCGTCATAFGDTPATPQTPPPESTQPAKPAAPAVADVVPLAAQVTADADDTQLLLEQQLAPQPLENPLKTLEERLTDLKATWGKLGPLDQWRLDQVQEQRQRLLELTDAAKALSDQITSALSQLDSRRSRWQEREDYWGQWKKRTPPSTDPTLKKVGEQTAATVKKMLGLLNAAQPPLLALQQRAGTLLDQANRQLVEFERALTDLRRQVFRRNAPPLLSSDTAVQLGQVTRKRLQTGWTGFLQTDTSFLRHNGWLVALQLLLALGVGLFLLRRAPDQVAEEWEPFIAHPWATGLFAAIAFLTGFYDNLPGWGRFLSLALGASAALLLVRGLTERRNIRQAFIWIFAAYLTIRLGQLLSLPAPLPRILIALVAVVLAFGLTRVAHRSRQQDGAAGSGFRGALNAGALTGLIILLAQMLGFTVLAERLLLALLQSFWLVLFLYMLIRFGRGLIDYLLTRPALARLSFFQKAGDTVREQGKHLIEVLLVIAGLFTLARLWGLVPSELEAWQRIGDWSIAIGNFRLSLGQLVGVIVALYLAMVASWALRLFLDTEVYPRRKVELGTGESINRLLHYLLVVLGLLFAASLAGVNLQNFAVLAGAFGIGIGFGLQNIVNNFVSGLILLFERPVKVGDTLVLGGEWGTVRKIGLRSTVIETFDRAETIVPNSVLIQEQVTNWTLTNPISRLVIPVGVAYGTDLERVLRILIDVAHSHPKVLKWPEPSAIFTAFGESSLDCELRVYLSGVEHRLTVRSELGVSIQNRFLDEGIEIPFPQRDLHLRSIDSDVTRNLQAPAAGGSPASGDSRPKG